MKGMLAIAAAVGLVTAVNVDHISVAPLQAQDQVAALLTQIRTALGGEQKLAAVRALSAQGPTRRMLGARAVEGDVTVLVVRPDKLRRSEESTFFGSTSERISTFDGAQAWDETVSAARLGSGGGGGGGGDHDHGPAGYAGAFGPDHNHADGFDAHGPAESAGPGALTEEQMNAARVRRMKMELQRWTIAFLADSSRPFTKAGSAMSPDGPADLLETMDEADRPVRYIVERASHMPLMMQYQEVRPQPAAAPGVPNAADAARRRVEELRAQGAPKTATVTMHLGGYKKVDGVMLPHQIDISVDGQASETWTIDTFKINPKVKADAFRKQAR